LNFASTAENYSIHLTKDGNSIAYTELNERDVLCIINADDANMFDIQVLGDNNIVDGYVSATRNYSTNIKLSDNNWRGVDVRGYDVNGLKAGNTGRFYIDSYGKIVAFYDDVFIDGIDNAPHYAVILNAAADIDTWGKNEICLQVLDQSGEVLELTFAEEVLYYNLDSVDGAPYINGYYNTPEMMVETALIQNAGTFASAIIGEMMTYETDDAGKVTSITFPQDVDSEEKLYMPTKTAITAGYDEESMKLGFATLDKDTLVFYITNAAGTGTLTGYSVSGADPNYCRVAKAFELVAGDYKYVSFNNGEGAAKAVIIYNTSGYVFSTTPNIAVIESVGKTEISDDAYIVNYWVGGEFKTAQTVVGLPDITPSNAVKGDVWNLSVNNGVITSAEKIFDCIGTN